MKIRRWILFVLQTIFAPQTIADSTLKKDTLRLTTIYKKCGGTEHYWMENWQGR